MVTLAQTEELQLKETVEKTALKHIAIIMDGNRRWAREKGVETKEGHRAGADNLEKIAKDCNELGVK